MAIPLSELVKDLKADDVFLDLQTVGELLGLPAYALQSGKPAGMLLSVFANQIAKLWNKYPAPWMRSAFLDYATGDWLTLRAATRYKRYRSEQGFAIGTVVVENRGGGFYTITAGNVRIKNTAGKTFTNTTGGTLTSWLGGANPFPTLSMTFEADEAGAASNTPAAGILAYPTPPVQGPANVFAQTNAAVLLGSDEENDVHLKERCRLANAPLSSGGPKSAYESVALDVRVNATGDPVMPEPIGTDDAAYAAALPLNITRVRPRELGNNTVDVLLASAAGAASGNTSTPGSDVFVANAAIQLWAVPWGMTVTTHAASELAVAIGVVNLYVDRASLVTKAEAEASATAALLAYFATFPISGQRRVAGAAGKLYKGAVEAVAKASNAGIFDVDAPSLVDTAVAANEVVVPSYTVLAIVVTQ